MFISIIRKTGSQSDFIECTGYTTSPVPIEADPKQTRVLVTAHDVAVLGDDRHYEVDKALEDEVYAMNEYGKTIDRVV